MKKLGAVVLCTMVAAGIHAIDGRFVRSEPVADQPVVADSVTALVWQGCAAGQAGVACQTGSAEVKTWQQALAYCEGLAWGGRVDWRLPDVKELASLVDDRRADPSIDVDAFPATPGSQFWLSSSNAHVNNSAWCVDFGYGNVDTCLKSLAAAVRCVRSGP